MGCREEWPLQSRSLRETLGEGEKPRKFQSALTLKQLSGEIEISTGKDEPGRNLSQQRGKDIPRGGFKLGTKSEAKETCQGRKAATLSAALPLPSRSSPILSRSGRQKKGGRRAPNAPDQKFRESRKKRRVSDERLGKGDSERAGKTPQKEKAVKLSQLKALGKKKPARRKQEWLLRDW